MPLGSDVVSSVCARCGASYRAADPDDECPRCVLEMGGALLRMAGDADSLAAPAAPHGPAFADGTRLGPYEVERFLARGGMGDVYRARDIRLGRTVAIKAMRRGLARTALWREHFEHEARIVAGLNHPHICSVFDVGHADDTPFVVMEFVEGETLAARLEQGPLALERALVYGVQMARALAEAHRHGVVHRDVKPANIIITSRGVKLLDFGLAGLDAQHVARVGVAGTPMYMAPEQWAGAAVDHRTDLFALGVVLHEMIAGGRPFADGSDRAPVPLPPDCPLEVAQTVRRCLAANPDDRVQGADRVEHVLLRAFRERTGAGSIRDVWRRLAAAAVAGMLMLPEAVSWVDAWRASASAPSIRFTLAPPSVPRVETTPRGVAVIAPEGRRVAWLVSHGNGTTSLAVQPLDAARVTHFAGTDGARLPSWTPDGDHILFFAAQRLRRVSTRNGTVTDVAPAAFGQGASASRTGAILFAPDTSSSLSLVAAPGLPPVKVRTLDAEGGEIAQEAPVFLPDSQHYLYLSVRADRRHAIFLGDLRRAESHRLVESESAGAFAAPDHLLFTREGALHAVRFDASTGGLGGAPMLVETAIQTSRNPAFRMFSASLDGTLVFHTLAPPTSQLVWFDRSGRRIRTATEPGVYRNPALADDGLIVAQQFVTPTRAALVVLDSRDSREPERLPHVDRASAPTWAPGGRRLAFAVNDRDEHRVFTTTLRSPVAPLLRADRTVVPTSWSPDGRLLLYERDVVDRGVELWVASVATGESAPYVTSLARAQQGRFSPDGRWVAYASDARGQFDIYVDSFPTAGRPQRISTGGGQQPLWRQNGRELFYMTASRHVMAVPVRSDRAAFSAGPPVPLFEVPRGELLDSRTYAVSPDGERVLLNLQTNQSAQSAGMTATVVTNWRRTMPQ